MTTFPLPGSERVTSGHVDSRVTLPAKLLRNNDRYLIQVLLNLGDPSTEIPGPVARTLQTTAFCHDSAVVL